MMQEKPEYPMSYMIEWLNSEKGKLPEVSNTKAKDPDFGRSIGKLTP